MHRCVSLLPLLALLASCGPLSTELDLDFASALVEVGLPDGHSAGKADSEQSEICEALQGAFSIYFTGWVAQADVGLGISLKGFTGRDYIWDLSHHQCTVSSYAGAGAAHGVAVAGSGAVIAGQASLYTGYGGGPRDMITDWNGHFAMVGAQANLSRAIPLVGNLPVAAGIGLTAFWAAHDLDDSGSIDPLELAGQMIADYRNRIAGVSFGPTLIGELVPSLGGAALMHGLWTNDSERTRSVGRRDVDLRARLRSDEHGREYVEYGDASLSHTERAKLLSRAIRRDWGWLDPSAHYATYHARDLAARRDRAARRALAEGVINDHGANVAEICPHLVR